MTLTPPIYRFIDYSGRVIVDSRQYAYTINLIITYIQPSQLLLDLCSSHSEKSLLVIGSPTHRLTINPQRRARKTKPRHEAQNFEIHRIVHIINNISLTFSLMVILLEESINYVATPMNSRP